MWDPRRALEALLLHGGGEDAQDELSSLRQVIQVVHQGSGAVLP